MADPPVTRAGGQQRRSGGQGAGGRQFLGLPAWMWAVGGVAVVAGYLYIKNKSSSQQAGQGTGTGGGQGGGGGAPTGWSSSSFMSWIQDHQGTPRAPKPHPKPKPKDPDPGKGKGDGHGK